MTDQDLPPISTTLEDEIEVRGRKLAGELIGQVSFTEMFLLDLEGELPPPGKVRVVDAVLVALMEHGTTPSSLASRLVMDGAPESMQGAVAAGLLATGSRFLGTIDRVAASLEEIVDSPEPVDRAAAAEVERLRARGERVPGMGHNLHGDVDPRVERILGVAREEGLAGRYTQALASLHDAGQASAGRPLVLNAVGAIGAVLCDLGYSSQQVRGFALVARCAGLFAHVVDEARRPIGREVWQRVHAEQNHPRPD